ncbi:hypothetical protein [Shewanella sp. ENK2]|uniref:hypothetical protein n=1 Tax=Shewanella sp. ENK2 TaxID=2775245 RepID=UPI0037497807
MINNFRNIFKTTNKDKVKPKKDNQQNKKFTTSDLNEVTKVRPTLNKNGLAGLLGDITNLLSKKMKLSLNL